MRHMYLAHVGLLGIAMLRPEQYLNAATLIWIAFLIYQVVVFTTYVHPQKVWQAILGIVLVPFILLGIFLGTGSSINAFYYSVGLVDILTIIIAIYLLTIKLGWQSRKEFQKDFRSQNWIIKILGIFTMGPIIIGFLGGLSYALFVFSKKAVLLASGGDIFIILSIIGSIAYSCYLVMTRIEKARITRKQLIWLLIHLGVTSVYIWIIIPLIIM